MPARARPFLLAWIWFAAALQLALFGAASRAGTSVDAAAARSQLQTESLPSADDSRVRTPEPLLRRLLTTAFLFATPVGLGLSRVAVESPGRVASVAGADAVVSLPRSRAPPALS